MKKGKRDKVTGKCGGIARILGIEAEAAERFVREVQAIFPDRDSSVKAIHEHLLTHHASVGETSPVQVARALRAAAYGIPTSSTSSRAIPTDVSMVGDIEPTARAGPDPGC